MLLKILTTYNAFPFTAVTKWEKKCPIESKNEPDRQYLSKAGLANGGEEGGPVPWLR